MRKYELVLIFKPDLGEEIIDQEIENIKKIIVPFQGEILEVDKQGIKNLATTFKKLNTGYYTQCLFTAMPQSIEKIKYALKINEQVLNFLVLNISTPKKIRRQKKLKNAHAKQAVLADKG
ncbi:MAG: small subunit ribosomal protein S6 [Candidatus Magnetoglobus multicellularis str. Araruama]|uniref:Small ribosomal subunit protein bS6 n=1 Tax=Candidatus Magnetoglobus multicellularis str. Araruama TaxID=890399 RepID=A0A1V1NZY0_9BACT|nr:MAG: small subunit ribosomal protein S6 [Candidatus Magnetoglobus multicellularis str. Araruama]